MKRAFSAIALSIASLAILAGAASAQQPPVANPDQQLKTFDIQTVGPVLNELGVTWQAQEGNGQRYIAANAGGMLNFLLMPAACKGEAGAGCVGLSMVAIFEGDANPQTVRAFNYRYAFASAGLDPSGAAYIKRYEISDYGMPRGNLATSILVFLEQARILNNELSSASRTVSLDGYADDLAAASLNTVGLAAMGAETHAKGAVDLHQLGLEDSAGQIKFFIENARAPRNKIENVTKQ